MVVLATSSNIKCMRPQRGMRQPFSIRIGDFTVHPRRLGIAAEQLVIGAPLPYYELPKLAVPQHPAQHFEEPYEIGLAGTIGTDEHGRLR